MSTIYDKHHLVPFGEYVPFSEQLAAIGFDAFTGFGFRPGPGPLLMEIPGVAPFVPAICYEIIFPAEVGEALSDGAWILQLTNDAWFGPNAGPKQHLALAQIRAAEFGVPLVRVANTGITGIVDSSGRMVEALPLGEAGRIVRALPGDPPGVTPYAFWGDLVLFVLLVASLIFLAVRSAVLWLNRRLRSSR